MLYFSFTTKNSSDHETCRTLHWFSGGLADGPAWRILHSYLYLNMALFVNCSVVNISITDFTGCAISVKSCLLYYPCVVSGSRISSSCSRAQFCFPCLVLFSMAICMTTKSRSEPHHHFCAPQKHHAMDMTQENHL